MSAIHSSKRAKINDDDVDDASPETQTSTTPTVVPYAEITKSVHRVTRQTEARRITRMYEWRYFVACITAERHGRTQYMREIIDTLQRWGAHRKCTLPHGVGQCSRECAIDMYRTGVYMMQVIGIAWPEKPDTALDFAASHLLLPNTIGTRPPPPLPPVVRGPPVDLPSDIWHVIVRHHLCDIPTKLAVAHTCRRLAKLFILPMLPRRIQQISALMDALERQE